MKQLLDLAAITWQTFTLMFTDLRYILILLLVFSLVYRQYRESPRIRTGVLRAEAN